MPETPLVLTLEIDDLEAAKVLILPFVPEDKRALLASLHRTADGGLAVSDHGITVRLEGFVGPGG